MQMINAFHLKRHTRLVVSKINQY